MTTDYTELTRSFEAHDISPGAFRHVDHLAVAYAMLRKLDFITATAKYLESIRTLATNAGVPEKYNVTITLAYLSLIAERMRTTSHDGFDDFIANNPDLGAGNPLEAWYSAERLQSESARTTFLMPDRAP